MVKFKQFSEFKNDYDKEGFIDKVSSRYYPLRIKKFNSKQLQRYYLQYVKKWDKAYGNNILNNDTEQSEDSKLSAFVRERDGGCRLLSILSDEELEAWGVNHNGLGCILDAAHVFGKGGFPWMRFDDKNIVTLNRFSHNCLDTGKSPINGQMITDEQRLEWWRKITGNDWEYLIWRSRYKNFKDEYV